MLIPTLLTAQAGGYAGSFSRLGFGPRGMAMGNAMTSVATEGIYAYYNPAFAALAFDSRQVDLSTSLMSFDRSLHKLNGAVPIPPSAGLSVTIINASVSGIDGRTNSGYHTEMLSTNEYQFTSTFGIRFTNKLQGGLSIKYYLADYHDALESTPSFGFDAGLLYHATNKLHVGLAIKDLLAEYNWNSGAVYGEESSPSSTDRFPLQVRIGASYSITEELLISAEPGVLLPPEAAPVGQLRTGARYRLHELLTVRGGWQITDLNAVRVSHHGSAGFSIHLPFDILSPSVDYAFVPEPGHISSMHVFGLQLNL
ncbi:MAG: hypothetical protein U5K69_19390 [Balneolaceae bacterium]|nr:hypothetical protein [Balneolaceae bacterium]